MTRGRKAGGETLWESQATHVAAGTVCARLCTRVHRARAARWHPAPQHTLGHVPSLPRHVFAQSCHKRGCGSPCIVTLWAPSVPPAAHGVPTRGSVCPPSGAAGSGCLPAQNRGLSSDGLRGAVFTQPRRLAETIMPGMS